jgi:Tfp pilus assembly protein PilV
MIVMKIKPISVRFTQQRGFSLLEALLSIVIILAAGLGVVELFISADKKNKATTVQQIVQQAGSAMSQLLSTSYDSTSTQLVTSDVVKSGLMSNTYITASGGIVGPYGTLDVKQIESSPSEYYVIANNIPGDQAVSICQNMFTSSAVSAGSTDGAGSSFAKQVKDCQTIFGKGSTKKETMTFNFPREDYIDNTSAS